MNVKELEQVVLALRAELATITASVQTMLDRDTEDLNRMRADINGLGTIVTENRRVIAALQGRDSTYDASMDALRRLVTATADAHREDLIEMVNQSVGGVTSRVASLEAELSKVVAPELKLLGDKVHSTNRSAPSKRNMTDADALEVLTGRCKDMSHKEAGEQIGLTYAQVYSCRGEFTFKHVHKELRDSGWKNPWAR